MEDPGDIALRDDYLLIMTTKHGPGQRVVICCYCDARSVLPRDGARDLVCHGCGAPIRRIVALEPKHTARASHHGPAPSPRPAETPEHHRRHGDARRRRKAHKKRKKRSFVSRLANAFDDIEDILDLFD